MRRVAVVVLVVLTTALILMSACVRDSQDEGATTRQAWQATVTAWQGEATVTAQAISIYLTRVAAVATPTRQTQGE